MYECFSFQNNFHKRSIRSLQYVWMHYNGPFKTINWVNAMRGITLLFVCKIHWVNNYILITDKKILVINMLYFLFSWFILACTICYGKLWLNNMIKSHLVCHDIRPYVYDKSPIFIKRIFWRKQILYFDITYFCVSNVMKSRVWWWHTSMALSNVR